MFDKILLLPYFLTLKIRNGLYNSGIKKSFKAEVPTICVGNVTVGGTGKTPHTEMIIRTLLQSEEWGHSNIAVLSRGYKRKSKRFQQVSTSGPASFYGDEPLQIKKKFPSVTVALDKDRVEGCNLLCHPEKVRTSRKTRKCINKDFPTSDIIVLDDAFQYRRLKADLNIILVDYNRPVSDDYLIPLGNLRDLPERLQEADIIIITKCPYYMSDEEKEEWKQKVNLKEHQKLFFTNIRYCQPQPVFEGACDMRYSYSRKLILLTGIAKDAPLKQHLCDYYKIVEHFRMPDHHSFTASDISSLASSVKRYPQATIATTEKDAQRLRDCKIPFEIKKRMFQIPIEVNFLSDEENDRLRETLMKAITK